VSEDRIKDAADRAEAASADKTAGQQRGKPFKPGQSGNPKGRPEGSRHRATELVEILMAGDADAVAKAVISKALEGDMTAARLVLERIAPPRKGRAINLELPTIKNADDLASAQQAIISAMAQGAITVEEAGDAAKVLELVGSAIERRDLEARIEALEAKGSRS
jgi:hypothetical protein